MNKINFQISDAKQEDSFDIEKISKEVWLSTYVNKEFGITEDDISSKFGDDKELEIRSQEREVNAKEGTHYYIAKVDNRNIGFLISKKHDNGIELRALYVLEKYQGFGIGGELLRRFMKDNANINIFLHVATYNIDAINFYKKFGFIETENKSNYELKSGKAIPIVEMIIKV